MSDWSTRLRHRVGAWLTRDMPRTVTYDEALQVLTQVTTGNLILFARTHVLVRVHEEQMPLHLRPHDSISLTFAPDADEMDIAIHVARGAGGG